MNIRMLAASTLCLVSCATHRPYDAAQFREVPVEYGRVTLHSGGLTAEQIAVIGSTRPPQKFPIDVAVILVTQGYVDARTQDMFAYDLVQGLKSSPQIERVTLIPSFLVPTEVGFDAIQELGVRSLSEYVLVFHLDASELYRWTKLLKSQYELSSAIAYIVVDSATSAMLTADRLQSAHVYEDKLFESAEREQAQREILSEQGRLLAAKLNELFSGR